MIVKAVQQIMLGKITRTEKETFATLETIKFAGYDGIELNGFMIRPTRHRGGGAKPPPPARGGGGAPPRRRRPPPRGGAEPMTGRLSPGKRD